MTNRPEHQTRWQAALACLSALSLASAVSCPGASTLAQTAQPGAALSVETKPLDPAQAQLIADSDKLVELSRQLKAEVDKSTKDTLSLTVVRKAQEVETLARSLKERMNKSR